jgi:hypothetical protein
MEFLNKIFDGPDTDTSKRCQEVREHILQLQKYVNDIKSLNEEQKLKKDTGELNQYPHLESFFRIIFHKPVTLSYSQYLTDTKETLLDFKIIKDKLYYSAYPLYFIKTEKTQSHSFYFLNNSIVNQIKKIEVVHKNSSVCLCYKNILSLKVKKCFVPNKIINPILGNPVDYTYKIGLINIKNLNYLLEGRFGFTSDNTKEIINSLKKKINTKTINQNYTCEAEFVSFLNTYKILLFDKNRNNCGNYIILNYETLLEINKNLMNIFIELQ